jgi:hypothetical protein
MSFLNSAFDSSTFMRTNYNYLKSLGSESNNSSAKNMNSNPKKLNTSTINLTGANQTNPVLHTTQSINSANMSGRLNGPVNPNMSSGSGGKPSLASKSHGSTNENRTMWLKHFAAASANAKKAYCSKTQIYCDAVSRALDIKTCKVVPFFGAFLHDLRNMIETVPSVTIMCNKNIQKPIEVNHFFLLILDSIV